MIASDPCARKHGNNPESLAAHPEVYGLWTVIAGSEHRRDKVRCVTCRCACGTERSVVFWTLKKGASKSCGCDRPQQTKHPLYTRYRSMLDRCHCESNKGYARYGGRGIYVCESWRSSFDAFVEDMGLPPQDDMQIDRIDNNGPYAPDNCRWADRVTQMRNMRANRLLTFKGETLCICEWAKRLGLAWTAIDHRLKAGWTVAEALTRSSHRGKRPIKRVDPVQPRRRGPKVAESTAKAWRLAPPKGQLF